MTKRARLSGIGVALVVLGQLFAGPAASANTRSFELVEFDFGEPDAGFCDFKVFHAEQGTFAIVDFFDNQGNPLKTLITPHGQLTLTFANLETGKSTTTHNESQVIKIDWTTGTVDRNGVIFAFTVPGAGAVLLQVGHVVQNADGDIVFVAGPAQLLEGDFGALCAALRG